MDDRCPKCHNNVVRMTVNDTQNYEKKYGVQDRPKYVLYNLYNIYI